jgi:hypothetical protein
MLKNGMQTIQLPSEDNKKTSGIDFALSEEWVEEMNNKKFTERQYLILLSGILLNR